MSFIASFSFSVLAQHRNHIPRRVYSIKLRSVMAKWKMFFSCCCFNPSTDPLARIQVLKGNQQSELVFIQRHRLAHSFPLLSVTIHPDLSDPRPRDDWADLPLFAASGLPPPGA